MSEQKRMSYLIDTTLLSMSADPAGFVRGEMEFVVAEFISAEIPEGKALKVELSYVDAE